MRLAACGLKLIINYIVRPRVAFKDKPSEIATEEYAGTKEFIDILKKE